jgi:hypothetical protein
VTDQPEVHEKEVGGLPIARPEDLPDEFRDMAMTPAEAVRRREALLRFVADVLEEADYDNGRPTRINDYYKVPGSNGLALSKRGAEKLGDLYRFKILHSEVVDHRCEKEFCYARARVTLHRAGQVVAEREGSASTAEVQFQRAAKKYGGDFRAADNDIVAKAQKRAFVQALIAALSATEILAAADEYEAPVDVDESTGEVVANGGKIPPDTLVTAYRLSSKALRVRAITKEEAEKYDLWLGNEKRTESEVRDSCIVLEDKIAKLEEDGSPIK